MSSSTAAEEERIRRRVERLSGEVVRPINRAAKLDLLSSGLALGLGFGLSVLTREPLWMAAGSVAAFAGMALAWSWLRTRQNRAVVELVYDHAVHERAEWRRETGTAMPRNATAARRWLEEHPDGPDRATLLIWLGRLAEADAVIAAAEPKTPEEAYGFEILRCQRQVYGGARPDVGALHAEWRSLPDPIERRHRRECLALLDALIAVNDGLDPWPCIVDGRTDIREVDPSMRFGRLAGRRVVGQVLAIATTVLVFGLLPPA